VHSKAFRHIRAGGPVGVFLGAALLTGCAQPVKVDGAWQDGASREQPFTRVLVVGVSPKLNQRCSFETFLATRIRSEATIAITSCNAMPHEEPLTRENIERAVAEQRADAVLATILVASTAAVKDGGTGDTRGGSYYKATDIGYATGYYGGFGVYGVPVVYGEFQTAPSIMGLERQVEIVTRLFETDNAALVYELNTKAKSLDSRAEGLAEVTSQIAERLRREGLIR
jgi:hypothetical protein